ncbi:ABC transporter permease [Abyssalbus ytuae]|uniref:ABC transporter permease n=1 Tax=Abyssalbus ytuae TaxID=2926907 RepID=A0A9E7D4B1_9FLAO|nr:ABC transporter permease [Abyssalbus ytuae]UOB18714.1 ABC transporter permease [Abyssalbus ytuae]
MTIILSAINNLTLRKFKKNFWGVLSFFIILAFAFISVFAYKLAPDNSVNANQMHLSIHSKNPGFKVQILTIPSGEVTRQSYVDKFFFGEKNSDLEQPILNYRINQEKLFITEYAGEGILGLEKEIPLEKFPGNLSAEQIAEKYVSTKKFLLGTDKYGRDLLSRLIVGTRISFSIGFIAVIISLIIGLSFGAVAGFFGGKIDAFIMWIVNITWSIPTLLLVIAITLALGKGFWQVFIAVGLTMWVEVARIVRGQVMSVKQMQYITAATALGYSNFRIIFKHILPNVTAPVIVISAANFAAAILIESGLSFLGIGAQPPMPSWGSMIKDHYSYIIVGKPYLAIIPGIAIMALVMAFMLMGNAIRDTLDVKN